MSDYETNNYLLNNDEIDYLPDLNSIIQQDKLPYWTKWKHIDSSMNDNIIQDKKNRGNTYLKELFHEFKNSIKSKIIVPKTVLLPGFVNDQYYGRDRIKSLSSRDKDKIVKDVLLIRAQINNEYSECLDNYQNYKQNDHLVIFLQCQPEKSTAPLAGQYVNQLFAISCIRNWCPSEINILVKEHPSQFKSWQALEKGRKLGYYRTIKDLGCYIIDHKLDNHELLTNAKGIISVSGSIVFEAWVLGYRSAYLGFPWYKTIDDIKKLENSDDLRSWLSKDEDELNLSPQLTIFKQHAFPGYISPYIEDVYLLERSIDPDSEKVANTLMSNIND